MACGQNAPDLSKSYSSMCLIYGQFAYIYIYTGRIYILTLTHELTQATL